MKKLYLVYSLILLLVLAGCSKPEKKTEIYAAGFKTIHLTDSSRIYKPGSDVADRLHFRPIDLDVWYPATTVGSDSALTFRDLLNLLILRVDIYTGTPAAPGTLDQIAGYLCNGFKCSDTTKLLNFKSQSYENAPAVSGKFPMVVYLASYNGMCYENFTLFEKLASRGYVVASVSSIGTYPGDMTMKKADLMEQVDDALFSIQALSEDPSVDTSDIGLIGYSWGGLAGAVIAGKRPGLKCLISWDGSEYHHYGNDRSEDSDFNQTANGEDFKNMTLTIPYLRLESYPDSTSTKKDSIYNFSAHVRNKLILRVDSAGHEDFCCLGDVARSSGGCDSTGTYSTILSLTLGYIDNKQKGADEFSNVLKDNLGKTVKVK